MFLYLQQELMKISMTIVQFLCTADWPLCLLGRNSSPDWGGDAVQVRGNHSICVYGKPEHQQQDTKHLIVVFRHELMLDVTDCAHDPSGEKPSHKKTIPQDRKKITSFLIPAECECRVSCLDLCARCEHVTTALYPVWYCLSEMKGCQVLIWAGVCECVQRVYAHTCKVLLDTCTHRVCKSTRKVSSAERKQATFTRNPHLRVFYLSEWNVILWMFHGQNVVSVVFFPPDVLVRFHTVQKMSLHHLRSLFRWFFLLTSAKFRL